MIDAARTLIDQWPTPGMACRAGCWSCCIHGGPLVPLAELAEIVERLTASGYDLDAALKRTGCPFFEAGCTIYDERPIKCRAYRSTSRAECERCSVNGVVDERLLRFMDQGLLMVGEAISERIGEDQSLMYWGLRRVLEAQR